MSFHVPEQFRIKTGALGTRSTDGNNGAFFIKSIKLRGVILRVLASDGEGWEHVSVSLPQRCPTWDEMAFIKSLFWDAEDLVVQFHPPASEYVNCHPYCLHLWRKVGTNDFCEMPGSLLVGPNGVTA